jgi:group I intron endonuclease
MVRNFYTLIIEISLISRGEEVMCGIYKITNSINNKVYIGQSTNISRRWNAHHNEPFNKLSPAHDCCFYRAIRKYGIENFTFEVLEECSPQELDEKERYYISLFDSYANGYNENFGGRDTFGGHKLSIEQVLEIKEKLASQQFTLAQLSEEYQVHKDTIRNINNGWSWSLL